MAHEHLPYIAHLKKRGYDDRLPFDADAIQQLLESEGWRVLTELVEYVHGQAVTRLVFEHSGSEGHVLDQAEYARLLGFLSGLGQARVAAEAFLLHAERVRRKENV
jgi:hypothetical protein